MLGHMYHVHDMLPSDQYPSALPNAILARAAAHTQYSLKIYSSTIMTCVPYVVLCADLLCLLPSGKTICTRVVPAASDISNTIYESMYRSVCVWFEVLVSGENDLTVFTTVWE